MTRLLLSIFLVAAVSFFAMPARGEDARPCAAEADAVRKMKKRDVSLEYPTDESAKEHMEKAKRAFGVGEYETAAEHYTAAGLADDAPLILYNLGQTYREAKEYEKAIRQYKLFLERGKPGDEVRALVECHITTMKAELEHAASTAPPSGPISEPAGPATGGPTTTEPEPIEDPVDGSPSRWTTTRRVSLGVGALGLVSVAAGAVFGLQANGYKDDAASLCPSEPCADADRANELGDKADTRALMANVSFGVGAGLVATAVVLWFVGAPSDSSEVASGRALVVPRLTSDAATLEVTLRF